MKKNKKKKKKKEKKKKKKSQVKSRFTLLGGKKAICTLTLTFVLVPQFPF